MPTTYCSRPDGCTMCELELCNGNRKEHLKCDSCEYCRVNRSLEYYVVRTCAKANNREIRYNKDNGWVRMNWCPVIK